MNFQKKYFYTFKNIDEEEYIVEIWQDITGTTLTPVEVLGSVEPFSIEYTQIENKITPIHGSGANINLIADSSNDFLNLYTGKIQQYQVRCYKGSSLIWCGYLDSELFSSDFSNVDNYAVSFTATDGFALLDRINYVQNSYLDAGASGYTYVFYSGITTQWEVLTNILTKLGLPYNDIRIGLSTTSRDFTIGNYETIFHKTFIINTNYINESLEPETCRKVLEGILQPYGAFIQQVNGSIYITDLNYIANNNIQPFEGFNPVDYSGIGTAYINFNLGDLSTIGFKSDQSQLDIISPVNKVVISYSNYKGVDVLDYTSTDFSVSGSTSSPIGVTNYQWTETPYSNSDSWYKFNNGRFISMFGYGVQSGTTESYLSTRATTNVDLMVNKSFTYKKELPYIVPTNNYKLKIEMSAYFRSTDNLNKDSDSSKVNFYSGRVMAKIKIGDRYLTGKDGGDTATNNYPATHGNKWTTTNDLTVAHNFPFAFYNITSTTNVLDITFNPMNEQWINFNDNVFVSTKGVQSNDYLVDLSGISGGEISLEIYDAMTWGWSGGGFSSNGSYLKEVRIKDVKFTIVDKDGKELNISDTEYFSNMLPEYKDEQKVDLIHGTNTSNCPVDRGSLLYYADSKYNFCTKWTRENNTNILEKLLQNTIKSNYLTPTIQLSCTTNNLTSLIGCLTYSNWLAGKKFMITGAKLNLEDAKTELTIAEVSKDVYNIL